MRDYELTYLISSSLSEEELRSLQEKIISLIQELGGELLGEAKAPMRKKIAYPVRKKSSNGACLATLNFHLDPEKLSSFEKRLKSESQILRYIILSKTQTKPPTTFRKKMIGGKLTISRKKVVGGKVELKEIEKKLEEILGE